ncbi:MAG: serine/threonine-protein kinase [Polyangiaceae bacterium]
MNVLTIAETQSGKAAEPAAGDLVGGAYRLVAPLGRGASSVVWLAEDERTGTTVAVKALHPSDSARAKFEERFEREVRILGRLHGASGVRLVASGDHGGVPFVVMEHVRGITLARLLRRKGHLGLPFVGHLVRSLLATLAAVHAEGVVHRDVKPSNLVVEGTTDRARLALVDFGLATSVDEPWITGHGVTVGTALYMSPEQAFSPEPTDVHADLWAAAVVAYECLTGRPPFEGDTFASVCVALHRGMFPDATVLREDLPPALDAFFDVAFAPAKGSRFHDAASMSEAFDDALSDERSAQVVARARAEARRAGSLTSRRSHAA